MPQTPIPLVSQYLRRLTARYGDPSTDHDLLQRFLACREEAAFAALVERHAAMVLGLCRSILRNHHEAEDIFQAVFLVLARKAGSIRKGESVGSWLYAVASRLAHKARVRAGKRRRCEQQAATPVEQTPMDDVSWGELRDILHEEVSRLPEKYRAAIVLCYWEGRTHEQAGQQLGCARSTIKDRLEKAREMLRKRLARRGLALSAAWFAASLSEGMSAAVSAALVQTTVRGAILFAMGQLPAGSVSAAAIACAREILRGMLLSKFKYGLALILMLGVLGGGAGLAMLRPAMPAEPKEPAEQPKAALVSKQEQEHVDGQGDPLPVGAVARLGTLRFRHADPITRIAIGADGTSILSAAGKAVYVWDPDTGKERRRFRKHETPVRSFAGSRDGKLLASGCQDGTIHLWHAATGRELHHFMAHKGQAPDWEGPPGAFVSGFTPDGRHIVSVGSENTIRLWDAASGEKIRDFGRFSAVTIVSLSPDSKILAALGWERRSNRTLILLWAVDTGRPLASLEAPVGLANVGSSAHARVAFSPDGRTLAAGGQGVESSIYLWEVVSGQRRLTLKHGEDVASLAFSPDGKLLAAANNINNVRDLIAQGRIDPHVGSKSRSPRVHLWDMAAEKELPPLEGHQGAITSLAFSPDGKLLATGSNDTTVLLWDATRFKTNRPAEVQLRPEQMESLWVDLGGADAVKAYRAIRALAAAPKSSVAFLKRHLHPVAPADAKRVARLLADLDSDQFAVREKAMQELEKLGDRAATELRKALAGKPPLEVKRRIDLLLEKEIGGEHVRRVRALETLERVGTPEARRLCAELAGGVPDAPLTREARATMQRMAR